MDTPRSAVADFIASRIKHVGKTQREIAREAGFVRPNVLTMIKRGQTKVPLARVGALARALETDPLMLMKCASRSISRRLGRPSSPSSRKPSRPTRYCW